MDIHSHIQEGEHQQQDFKYKITNINKIARSLSAFANTDGGRLLVGVRDNGGIAGVDSDEEIYMIEAAANLCCKPSLNCSMRVEVVEGHRVLVAEVPPSQVLPVFAIEEDGRKRAYVRVDDENIVASPVHLSIWRTSDRGCTLGEEEFRCLNLIPQEGVTLNRFTRSSRLPRRVAVNLLADFVRLGLVRQTLVGQKWLYSCL